MRANYTPLKTNRVRENPHSEESLKEICMDFVMNIPDGFPRDRKHIRNAIKMRYGNTACKPIYKRVMVMLNDME